MCIGIPMQVRAVEPGHAVCTGRGERRRVRTALVGEPLVGAWLLVFIDSAIETLSAERAAEIDATLDLLQHAMAGTASDDAASFALPSQLSAAALQRLTGGH